MHKTQSLADLSPRHKTRLGLAVAGLGIVEAALVVTHPEKLNVPLWLALAACLVFVLAGMAIALHARLSAGGYRRFMLAMLATMGSIPAWIAFGPGPRQCGSSIPILAAESGCRAAFGLATLIVLAIIAAALAHKSGAPK